MLSALLQSLLENLFMIRDICNASPPGSLDARQSSIELGYNNLNSGEVWLKHASGKSRSVPVGVPADSLS